MPNTATDKQLAFIESLKQQRDITSPEAAQALELGRQLWRMGEFSKPAASAMIDVLKAAPKPAQAERPEPVAGVYGAADDDRLFRVYLGQQSGKMLVSLIVTEGLDKDDEKVEYEYLGLATKNLPEDATRLSVEEVGALGKTFNHCLICGHRLDVPKSVDRGIGPKCFAKYV